MLQRLVFIIFCLCFCNVKAQDLDWVKPVANDSFSNIRVTKVTPEGDILALVNSYYILRNDTIDYSRGNISLEKFNAAGEKIWQLPFSSAYSAGIYDFVIDSTGNVYVIGTFRKEMQLAGKTFTTDSMADFVAKLNADYQLVWLRKSLGLYFNSIGLMPQEKVILKASTREKEILLEDVNKNATFQTEYARNYNFTAYDFDGNLLWSKFYGGDYFGYIGGSWYTKVTKNGIYELCSWSGTIDLETGPGKTLLSQSERSYDNYHLSRYDSNGEFLWVKTIQKDTTTYSGQITRIAFDADNDGNIFLAGGFYGKVDFDLTSKEYVIDRFNKNNWHQNHYFLAKYDENLNLIWAKATKNGFKDNSFRFRLRLHSTGKSVYLYGVHWSGLDLDFNNPEFRLLGDLNHFFAEYDMEGKFLTARNIGEEKAYFEHSQLWNLDVDEHKNLYISGMYYPTGKFDFDPSEDSVFISDTVKKNTGFIARYQTCKKPIKIIPQYENNGCHERMTTLYVQNDHFPVKWYDENNNLLHEGITYTLPKINNATKIWAEDGCNYRDEIEIERQNRWMNIQKIYPNPVRDNLTIALEGISDAELNVQLINTLGQNALAGKYHITNGFQNVSFPIEGLKEGVYLLILHNNCIRQSEKIVIVK